MGPQHTPDDQAVGTLAQEATALLGALASWAKDNAGEVAGAAFDGGPTRYGNQGSASADEQGLQDRPAQERGSDRGNERVGGEQVGREQAHEQPHDCTCRSCPVCRLLAMAKHITPEVRQHLLDAGSSLVAAVAAVLSTPVPDDTSARPGGERSAAADAAREQDASAADGARPKVARIRVEDESEAPIRRNA